MFTKYRSVGFSSNQRRIESLSKCDDNRYRSFLTRRADKSESCLVDLQLGPLCQNIFDVFPLIPPQVLLLQLILFLKHLTRFLQMWGANFCTMVISLYSFLPRTIRHQIHVRHSRCIYVIGGILLFTTAEIRIHGCSKPIPHLIFILPYPTSA